MPKCRLVKTSSLTPNLDSLTNSNGIHPSATADHNWFYIFVFWGNCYASIERHRIPLSKGLFGFWSAIMHAH